VIKVDSVSAIARFGELCVDL